MLPVNDPAVLAEVEAAFARYEAALVGNDVAALDALFWPDGRTIRYGGGENLYGFAAIAAFRAAVAEGNATQWDDQYMRMSLFFETTSPNYAWMNESLFLARGRLLGSTRIEYDVYRVN